MYWDGGGHFCPENVKKIKGGPPLRVFPGDFAKFGESPYQLLRILGKFSEKNEKTGGNSPNNGVNRVSVQPFDEKTFPPHFRGQAIG